MATLVLGAVGTAIGASFGTGMILGMSYAAIGGAIGSAVGSAVDAWIVQSMQPNQNYYGAQLESLKVTSSTEGAVIPQVYGRMRVGGNVIWATDFREEVNKETQGAGKGGGGKVTTTTYTYYASFAVALCEGPITGIGRIWADGEVMDLDDVTYRIYYGDEDQEPDPFIDAMMGGAPAYRGTAYIVFEDLLLEDYGNRLPQINVEIFNALDDEDVAEGQVRSVTIIPSTGEYAYATEIVKSKSDGETIAENSHNDKTESDIVAALDRLQASVPGIESVSLVVSWFGTDLRCGECQIKPGVEKSSKSNLSKIWIVSGAKRSDALLVTAIDGDPQFGGTPADFSVIQAIEEIKSRGLKVTFYPFILMDVPPDNTLPNPYSDNGAEIGQPVFPWRGRITCHPAPGYVGTVDKTSAAADQVDDFFGNADPDDFIIVRDLGDNLSISDFSSLEEFLAALASLFLNSGKAGEYVSFSGSSNDWGYRRMILHYAYMCAAAGGVDAFLIGSELRGLTTIRSASGTYPVVSKLQELAEDVRGILGSGTAISYAADWSEYFGHHPSDGSGDVYFHLDPLWAHDDIDFIGIDNYFPIADWRDGFDHLDAQEYLTTYDLDYLRGNIEGGEGFDWYYPTSTDRVDQVRTPITDGAYGKPWVYRPKDLRSWWTNQHYNRPGGVEEATATDWVPQSKPFWFTEVGCPAVDRGPNQPNVFFDAKSSESAIPYFSRGWRDDAIQRAYLEATFSYWGDDANNPVSSVTGDRMIDVPNMTVWTWDARPFPFFPYTTDDDGDPVWGDADNWTLGHWITGRLGSSSLRSLVSRLCIQAGLDTDEFDVSDLRGAVQGISIVSLTSPRSTIASLAKQYGFDATETQGRIVFKMRGANPSATVSPGDMVASDSEVIQFERAQETELAQGLKWAVASSDEDYDTAQVEARRQTVNSSRITAESFSFAMPPEDAERNVRRALQETWVGRETASFKLPPSMLALDATDVIEVLHDDRSYLFRAQTINDGEERTVSAMMQDKFVYDLPPGRARSGASVARGTSNIYGDPIFEFLDIPWITQDGLDYQPFFAAYAKPWPGEINLWKSPEESGYTLLTSTSAAAQMGVTTADFAAGPVGRWDDANALYVRVYTGTIDGVEDIDLLAGSNTFALETSDGKWEIIQAAEVELVGS
ncbi:baseplate multidomain protein megatron, partial [Celeribacter halophilus]